MKEMMIVENQSTLDQVLGMLNRAPEIMASTSGLGPYGAIIGLALVAILVLGVVVIWWIGKGQENKKALKESRTQGEKDQRDLKKENQNLERDTTDSEKELDEIAKGLKK